MDFHEYAAARGVTPQLVREAHELTLERIEAYNLAQLRRERKKTQMQVAEAMGVAQPRVSAIESGEINKTEVGTLRKYVESLGARLVMGVELPDKTVRLV